MANEELELSLTGSGSRIAAGQAQHLLVRVEGSGQVQAAGLAAHQAQLHLLGSGAIESQAGQRVLTRITGSGAIRVSGNARDRDVQVCGSGAVHFAAAARS